MGNEVPVLIALAALLVAGAASFLTLRRSSDVGAQLDAMEKRLADMQMRYQTLVAEYLRLVGENHWLREQLRRAGIDIPPLPPDLQPHVDAAGNISIVVNPHGGVSVTGGQWQVAGDMAAGDVNKGKTK